MFSPSRRPTPGRTTNKTHRVDTSSEASGHVPCDEDDEDCDDAYGSDSANHASAAAASASETQLGVVGTAASMQKSVVGDREKQLYNSADRSIDGKTLQSLLSLVPTTSPTSTAVNSTARTSGGGGTKLPPTGVDTASTAKSAVGGGKSGKHSSPLGMSVGLIVGIVGGVLVVLFVLAYAVYKYRSRDEGTYKIDESKNYGYEVCNSKPMVHLNGRSKSAADRSSRHKRKDTKEWYV